MNDAMQKYAVIVAGGNGLRMGADKPKQFLNLRGKPILWHTLQRFLAAYADLQLILVLPNDFMAEGNALINSFDEKERIQMIAGGATRFDSVKNGLQLIVSPGIVFVHDGVRCLISVDLIRRCYDQAVVKGSAIPAVAATDSIRIVQGDTNRVVDRNRVRIIQTPQTFQTTLLLPAFNRNYESSFTDEATVLEASGTPVHLIEGEYSNIKITRPIDLLIAEKILEEGI